jgi:hypothetical protein
MSKWTLLLTSLFPMSAGAIAGAIVLLRPTTAPAQVDPDQRSFAVVQNSAVVGEIWREGTNPKHYVEHWVLYPGYLYPSTVNQVSATLRPGHHTYANTADFLAHVPFEEGSRYVKVDCDDSESIPGR